MACIHIGPPFNGILTIGGPTYTIIVDGKRWYFETESYPGFHFLKKNGDDLKNWPSSKHPVWDAIEAWKAQGRRVDENDVCIWEPVPKPDPLANAVHLGGNQWVVSTSKEDAERQRDEIVAKAEAIQAERLEKKITKAMRGPNKGEPT